MIPKLHLLLLRKTTQWNIPLSNFAFVTAASAIFAVVTLTSAILLFTASACDISG
jgi:hypothetical protein